MSVNVCNAPSLMSAGFPVYQALCWLMLSCFVENIFLPSCIAFNKLAIKLIVIHLEAASLFFVVDLRACSLSLVFCSSAAVTSWSGSSCVYPAITLKHLVITYHEPLSLDLCVSAVLKTLPLLSFERFNFSFIHFLSSLWDSIRSMLDFWVCFSFHTFSQFFVSSFFCTEF